MRNQSQIKRTLSHPEGIERIRELLNGSGDLHRTAIAEQLCEDFGFFDPRGAPQRSGCLKALRDLERKGHFELPSPLIEKSPPIPKRLGEPVPAPDDVPDEAGEVRGLRFVLVEAEKQMRIWNELMIRDHPRGAGPLVGRQLRYLIGSDHGWLGGLGFAASALQLRDRDRWIGWDVETRRRHLDRVVGLSRFLIRSDVRCRNLASRVLGMSMQCLGDAFEARYEFRPWLVETFVDTSRFSGTCYRAANWVRVGRTSGRGRQDRFRQSAETIKDIYVYPLEKDFRVRMGLPPERGLVPLKIAEGVDGEVWAENEFGDAPVGDKRLSKRLVVSAATQATAPGSTFSGAAEGDWPSAKGYYRMIDQPDDSAVTMENILRPHRERTVRRMKAQRTVLCIHDGTDLNYNGLAQCEGLGDIGTNQTGATSRGLHLHSTLVVTPDGLPLGLLNAQCFAPEFKSKRDDRPRCSIPLEEKKTFCWVEALRDCMEAAEQMPHTRVVSVTDRESDFFEFFDEQRTNPCIDFVARAKHNRCTTEELNLFDAVKQTRVRTRMRIDVPRQSARPKKSKQKARPKRAKRTATVSVRHKRVELVPARYNNDKDPIGLWIIHAVESNPPADVERLEWFLLTTIDITSPEWAVTILRWYCLRWRIEDWHRVLKSGCRIEDLAHKTAERLKRVIAIRMVIAWRIMLMTLLGRETPELPAEVLYSDIEIEVLRGYAKKNG